MEQKLKKYIKKNFYHYEDYMEVARVIAAHTSETIKKIDKIMKSSDENELSIELVKQAFDKPDKNDFYDKKFQQYQNKYLVIELENLEYDLFDEDF